MLALHPSLPAHTVHELVQLAKTKAGTLNYASSGAGTNHHIAGELLNYLAKIANAWRATAPMSLPVRRRRR